MSAEKCGRNKIMAISLYEKKHFIRKFFIISLKMLFALRVRMFGKCLETGWDGNSEYCRYEYKGKTYYITDITEEINECA